MSEEANLKMKLRIAKLGFWTALLMAIVTLFDKFSGFLTGLQSQRQAGDPPPPDGDPEPVSYAAEIAFPTHWVIVILCLLVLLACLLAYKGYKKRHRRATQILA